MDQVSVRIPGALRMFTGGAAVLMVEAGSVRDIIGELGRRHPPLIARLLTPDGDLRTHVNVFLGHDNVRTLDGLRTPVKAGSTLHILPAVAGG